MPKYVEGESNPPSTGPVINSRSLLRATAHTLTERSAETSRPLMEGSGFYGAQSFFKNWYVCEEVTDTPAQHWDNSSSQR